MASAGWFAVLLVITFSAHRHVIAETVEYYDEVQAVMYGEFGDCDTTCGHGMKEQNLTICTNLVKCNLCTDRMINRTVNKEACRINCTGPDLLVTTPSGIMLAKPNQDPELVLSGSFKFFMYDVINLYYLFSNDALTFYRMPAYPEFLDTEAGRRIAKFDHNVTSATYEATGKFLFVCSTELGVRRINYDGTGLVDIMIPDGTPLFVGASVHTSGPNKYVVVAVDNLVYRVDHLTENQALGAGTTLFMGLDAGATKWIEIVLADSTGTNYAIYGATSSPKDLNIFSRTLMTAGSGAGIAEGLPASEYYTGMVYQDGALYVSESDTKTVYKVDISTKEMFRFHLFDEEVTGIALG